MNLGRWVLTNLFRKFIEFEIHHRRSSARHHPHHPHHISLNDLVHNPRNLLASPQIATALPTPTTPKVPLTVNTSIVPGKDGIPHLPTIPQSPSAGKTPTSGGVSSPTATSGPKSPLSPVDGDYFSPRAQSSRKAVSPGGSGQPGDDFGSWGSSNKDNKDKEKEKEPVTPGGGLKGFLKWKGGKPPKTPTFTEKSLEAEDEAKVR